MKGEKIRAGEQIFTYLKDEIQNGRISPGDKLPSENEIAEKYNVSRNTVRDAINKLAALGIVETFHGKGTFIKEIKVNDEIDSLIPQFVRESSDYLSMMNLRIAIETQAVYLAAINSTYHDIDAIEAILLDLERHGTDLEYYSNKDMEFHNKIVECSGNKLFYSILQIVRRVLDDVMIDFIVDFGNYESLSSHRKIFEAIKTANPGKASKYMHQHLQMVIDRYFHIFRQSGK